MYYAIVFAKETIPLNMTLIPPYVTGENTNPGFFEQELQRIFTDSNIEFKIQYKPMLRMLQDFERGSTDYLFYFADFLKLKEESKQNYKFKYFCEFHNVLFYNKEKIKKDLVEKGKIAKLQPYKIGVLDGTPIRLKYIKLNINHEVVPSIGSLFKMLEKGRIDAFILPKEMGTYYLKSLTSSSKNRIASSESIYSYLPIYFVIRKSDHHAKYISNHIDNLHLPRRRCI